MAAIVVPPNHHLVIDFNPRFLIPDVEVAATHGCIKYVGILLPYARGSSHAQARDSLWKSGYQTEGDVTRDSLGRKNVAV